MIQDWSGSGRKSATKRRSICCSRKLVSFLHPNRREINGGRPRKPAPAITH